MSRVSVSHVYRSSADRVWEVIGDPASLSSWHPAIASSPTEGEARLCTLADGGEVREEITARDEGGRSYTYRILESPLPMTDYVATLRVTTRDDGAEVVWESEFQPAGIDAAQLEEMIRGLYIAGLTALASKLS
jgi:hypothetical protein